MHVPTHESGKRTNKQHERAPSKEYIAQAFSSRMIFYTVANIEKSLIVFMKLCKKSAKSCQLTIFSASVGYWASKVPSICKLYFIWTFLVGHEWSYNNFTLVFLYKLFCGLVVRTIVLQSKVSVPVSDNLLSSCCNYDFTWEHRAICFLVQIGTLLGLYWGKNLSNRDQQLSCFLTPCY